MTKSKHLRKQETKPRIERPSNEEIIKALDDSYGIVTYAADKIGCSYRVLRKWIVEDEELQKSIIDAREKCKDLVENQIITNIKNGKEISSIFYAKTQMRDRGYIENPELQLPPMKINIVFQQEALPDNAPDITFERYEEPKKLTDLNVSEEEN